MEEFIHWFLPKDNIVDSYLVERGGIVTGSKHFQFPDYLQIFTV